MAEETFKPLLANVIGGVRKEYRNEEEPFLLEKNMDPNPLLQFRWWFKNIEEKVDQFMGDHNAVCVSTVNKSVHRVAFFPIEIRKHNHSGMGARAREWCC